MVGSGAGSVRRAGGGADRGTRRVAPELRASMDAFVANRAELVSSNGPINREIVGALTDLTMRLIAAIAASIDWQPGWSLLAVGGTGRRQLCPGSDIDLLLLHPKNAAESDVRTVSESLWYPFWDMGLKLSPSVHSESSALELAESEIVSAVTWLDAGYVAGDPHVADSFVAAALRHWRFKAKKQLPALIKATSERHARHGEVAFLLEPELREGRGGLRDVHVLSFIERSEHPAVPSAMERAVSELSAAHDALLGIRAELHRRTGRAQDRLLLQEQDAVAAGLSMESADELMSVVSAAARSIAWCTEESLRRLSDALNKRFPSRFGRPMKVAPNLSMQSGELLLADDADVKTDSTLLLRTAAAAALNRSAISRDTLRMFAEHSPAMPDPWPDRARNALVALLGAGPDMLPVMEALDQYDLIARILPEWSSVRAKPPYLS